MRYNRTVLSFSNFLTRVSPVRISMAGREQKAKEGKWNGSFAPYGNKLENGNLLIAEDEEETIRITIRRYLQIMYISFCWLSIICIILLVKQIRKTL